VAFDTCMQLQVGRAGLFVGSDPARGHLILFDGDCGVELAPARLHPYGWQRAAGERLTSPCSGRIRLRLLIRAVFCELYAEGQLI
jgi:hypothetical protein